MKFLEQIYENLNSSNFIAQTKINQSDDRQVSKFTYNLEFVLRTSFIVFWNGAYSSNCWLELVIQRDSNIFAI